MSFLDLFISKEKQLLNAIEENNIEKAKMLIEKGANVNAIVRQSGSRMLNEAIRNGNLKAVILLCEKGADVNPEYRGWFSPLKDAVWNKKLKIVKYLIENGANINAKDSSGKTALMDACEDGSIEIVKYFIEKGADINIKDNKEKTAYEITVKKAKACPGTKEEKKFWEIAKLFEDTDQVQNAIGAGDILKISGWLKNTEPAEKRKTENSIDIKSKEKSVLDQLIKACNENNLDAVKGLIEKGVEVNTKNTDGTTALLCASARGLDMVKYLIDKGADVNAKDKYGQSPLLIASLMGNLEVIKLLIDKGADINAKDTDGHTALWLIEKYIDQESGGDLEFKKIMEKDAFDILDYLGKHTGKQEIQQETKELSADSIKNNIDSEIFDVNAKFEKKYAVIIGANRLATDQDIEEIKNAGLLGNSTSVLTLQINMDSKKVIEMQAANVAYEGQYKKLAIQEWERKGINKNITDIIINKYISGDNALFLIANDK